MPPGVDGKKQGQMEQRDSNHEKVRVLSVPCTDCELIVIRNPDGFGWFASMPLLSNAMSNRDAFVSCNGAKQC